MSRRLNVVPKETDNEVNEAAATNSTLLVAGFVTAVAAAGVGLLIAKAMQKKKPPLLTAPENELVELGRS